MKKALIVASVASMIDQFNIPNIQLLKEMGYEVHVACNFINAGNIPNERTKELLEKLKDLNVKYFQVDFERNAFSIFRNLKAYKQLKLVLKNNYKLVHSHSPVGGVIARISANKYRKLGLKSIYTAHGFHFYEGAPLSMWLIFYPIEKIMSKMTDVLITINEEDYALSNTKMNARKVIYIPGIGIDLQVFKKVSNTNKELLRFEYRKTNDEFLLLYVAELNENKNQLFLIDCMEDLIKIDNSFKLLLVGEGQLKNKLKTIIKEKNLENNIELLGYRNDVSTLLQISDIYVASSRREGLPVNLMEAMASGLPIVTTINRGTRDLMDKSQNTFLVKEEKEIFNEAILKLYEDRKLRIQIGKENLEKSKKYSIDNVLSFHKEVYR